MAWNDERLDELSGRVDRGFARVDAELRDLRTEMREEFRDVRAEMRGEFSAVRGEMSGEFSAVRGEMSGGFSAVRGEMSDGFNAVNARIDGLHAMIFRLCIVMMVGMASLVATLIGSIAAGAL